MAKSASKPTTKSATVFVGCKLPHGLIIELNGVKVTLAGRNSARIVSNESYGVTEVASDFWTEWSTKNAQLKCVKNGFVFANSTERSTDAEAKEKSKEETGSEQLPQGSTNGIEPVVK